MSVSCNPVNGLYLNNYSDIYDTAKSEELKVHHLAFQEFLAALRRG